MVMMVEAIAARSEALRGITPKVLNYKTIAWTRSKTSAGTVINHPMGFTTKNQNDSGNS